MQQASFYQQDNSILPTYATQFLSGALSGMIADCATHPLDTIRVRVQCVRKTACKPSSLEIFKACMQQESWRGLYRGFSAVLTFSIPAHALYFSAYENSKRLLEKQGMNQELSPVVSGVAAEFCGGLIWTPQDVIKQRSQLQGAPGVVDDGKYSTLFRSCRTVWMEDGLKGFYRGYVIAFVSFAPFSALYFAGFEWSRNLILRLRSLPKQESNSIIDFIAGICGGGLATVLTTPLDILKTRYQVEKSIQFDSLQGYVNDPSRPSLRHITVQLYKEEGFRAFFRGVGIRLIWLVPAASITITVYEHLKRNLDLVFGKFKHI
eukprot:jgi/Galph1/5910/GphlegSOOS_G4574.1